MSWGLFLKFCLKREYFVWGRGVFYLIVGYGIGIGFIGLVVIKIGKYLKFCYF